MVRFVYGTLSTESCVPLDTGSCCFILMPCQAPCEKAGSVDEEARKLGLLLE